MELEFESLNDFLKSEIKLQKGDYLYEHDKDDYPLKNEFDISNLYFIIDVSNGNLEIHSMAEKKIRNIQLKELTGYWWILKIPFFIREKLGLET